MKVLTISTWHNVTWQDFYFRVHTCRHVCRHGETTTNRWIFMFANIQAFAISVIFKLFWRLYANITETIGSLPPKQYSEPPETLSSVTQTSLDRHQDHVQDHPNCHLSWPPQELYLNGQCTIHTRIWREKWEEKGWKLVDKVGGLGRTSWKMSSQKNWKM